MQPSWPSLFLEENARIPHFTELFRVPLYVCLP
jgi:hypothetical protein